MDLTPQVINEVEFSMARRGYDPDQVDEFLEKVAVAVGELTDRFAELRERVVAAERRAEDAEQRAAAPPERVVAGPAPSPAAAAAVSAAAEAELETLKRTLLLAQRTADAAVREAEEEARQLLADAEAKAKAAHEATLRRVLDEISQLEATRDSLRRDADALDVHVEAQRSRLTAVIGDLQRIVAEPTRLHDGAAPAPADAAAPVADLRVEADLEPDEPDERRAEPDDEPTPAPRSEAPRLVVAEDDPDDEAWARFGDADVDVVDDGPRTEPVLRLDRLERDAVGDDAYLSELRKAMLDDTGAPDADGDAYFGEADAARAARTRFGRKR